ncbi:MAG: macro domain-containing protein, partial [Nitrososphaera sp.]|nr:macro domain-containing protein [Nitrososphaera sp.]
MIKFVQGDIFQSKAETLIATVNCVGIMGKGLAKEFRLRYPEMYREYVKICKKGELRKGRLFHFKDLHSAILCFPTKDNWKGPSKYEFVEEGLKALVANYEKWQISSLAIPPLGCGLGGLDWDRVKSLIKKYLSHLPIEIEVYEPLVGAERIPSRNPFRKRGRIKLTPSLVYTGEIIRIARKAFPSDMPIGRLLLQKIAFFAQMAGLPIKLEFTEFEFGPYDRTLKYNVDRLEGLFVRDASPSLGKSDLRMLDEEEW